MADAGGMMFSKAEPRETLRRVVVLAALAIGTCSYSVHWLAAQQAPASAATAAPAEAQRQTSTPYTGDLSIFETKGRDERLQIQRVMDLLGIVPGSSVADIGAGSGWFTVRAAARVGAAGSVFAEDINPEAITYIRKRAETEKLPQVHAVLGSVDDPALPPASVDAMLIMKTYHEFAKPVELLRKLKLALKPGAKLGIIDRNGNGTDHGIMPDVVRREAAEAGLKLVGKYDFTRADGEDYFLVFVVK